MYFNCQLHLGSQDEQQTLALANLNVTVVRPPSFHCWNLDSIPGQGTKIPQAKRCGQISHRERETRRA